MGRSRKLAALFSIIVAGLISLAAGSRETLSAAAPPTNDIYPPPESAPVEIQNALKLAAQDHKNVLLIFGGNWCYDCHTLETLLHSSRVAPALEASYHVVNVNIGEFDRNLDLAKKYGVPMDQGVPALAVLDRYGLIIFSQRQGEFSSSDRGTPRKVVQFLEKWKPHPRPS